MDWLDHKLDVSINRNLVDKHAGGDEHWFAEGFEAQSITAEELLSNIQRGYAYAPVFRGKRKTANFTRCSVISLDFDTDVVSEKGASALIREAATVVYTTASHTAEDPRYRVLFALEQPIETASEFGAVTKLLARQHGADPAAAKAAQLFFGNRKAAGRVYDRGFTRDRVQELIQEATSSEQREGGSAQWQASGRSKKILDPEDPIRVASNWTQAKLQDLKRGTSVHCPIHDDKNASGFVVVSTKGAKGIHCSACQLTYWSKDSEPYNFASFDEAANMARELPGSQDHDLFDYQSPYRHLFPTDVDAASLKLSRVRLHSAQFVELEKLDSGVTYIKSPKGTGKTELLRALTESPYQSVLLVGHRRALIRQLCNRLKLSCYLDLNNDSVEVDKKRIGVCLDSLAKIRLGDFDLLLIDESEQVLAHFLSDTMSTKQSNLVLRLQHQIFKARNVIALDADLGWTTFRFIHGAGRGPKKPQGSTVVINDYRPTEKRPIRIFSSKNHLLEELRQCVDRGERCYVTSNSKALVDTIYQSLTELVPESELMKITSDNSQTEPVQDFLANIAEQAPLYRAIITSPSVSSGVDISFPNDAQLIDHVFGFFEALITSHFECDQQLGRVRNPKAVSVFLSPATFSFETDLDVVKRDLLVDRLLETLIDGYLPDGSMRFREDHPILDLAASVVSQERASKNHLRKNFIAHKIDQNYEIEMVEADEALVGIGKEHLSDAKEIVESQRVSALLSADRLSQDELDIAEDRAEKGNASDSMRWSIARTRLEVFYRTPISEELIARDKKGTLRRQVMLFTETLCAEPGRDSMLSEASLSKPLMKLQQTTSWKAAFMRKALNETGLWDEELHEDIVLTSPDDFTSFVAFLKSFKAIYETQFGTELRNDLSQKPTSQLNTLLRQIGLKLVSFNPPIIKGGKKSYRYVLDQKTLEEMRQIVERRKLCTDPWAAIADCEDEPSPSTTDAQFEGG